MSAVEIELSPEVAEAVDHAVPVVALESTIFSNLGLPAPANTEALTAFAEGREADFTTLPPGW